MISSFKKNHSQNYSRLLSMVAVVLLIATMLSACQKKETPTVDLGATPPNLLETTPPTEAAPTTPAPTEAEKTNVAIVKEQVNVRSSPSAESNIINQLDAGEEVEINRIESVNGIQWAYIPLKGWVTTDNLDMTNVSGLVDPNSTPANPDNTEPPPPTETTAPPVENNNSNANNNTANNNAAGKKGIITTNDLNIRSKPSTESDRVGGLSYGDRVAITETDNGWGKIDKGWISLKYVYIDGTTGTNTAKGIVTGTNLNVRSGPGTNYDAVTSYAQLNRVDILEQIKIGNTTWACTKDGWVSMDYIYVDGSKGEGAGTGTVTGDAVNIRSGPGTGYEAISSAKSGDTLEILAQFTIGDMTWGCTKNGWISMNYVSMG